jgi:hypothetical protein
MLEGPKSVRSKMITLLSFITCMCMAEMPMVFWSWIQCPNVLLVVVVMGVCVVINAVVWDMVMMMMKMIKECTFLILNAMDMV